MGTSALSASKHSPKSSPKPILNDYIPKKRIADPRYGESTLLEHKLTKDRAILKELTTNDSKEFLSTLLKWQSRVEMQHPNIVQVLGIEKKEESQYCSNFYKTFVLFEFIKHDLFEEISSKITEDTKYSEDDLWFFLYCIINALVYYKAFNVSHGDLKPSNIFISESGIYKIVDSTVFNNVSSYMQMQWNPQSSQNNNIYLSPDLLKSLSQNLVQPKHNVNKSDIFTLGMIVLHMATLESCDKCYDIKMKNEEKDSFHFSIKKEEVDVKLGVLKGIYKDKLFFFVKGMLIEDEKDRPNYEDLLNIFRGSYDTKSDERFKELSNHQIRLPPSSLVDSKTYELLNSKKLEDIGHEIISPEQAAKPVAQAHKNVFSNLMKKAFNQLEPPQKEKEPEAEKSPPVPINNQNNNGTETFDPDDEYLNLLLMKEGKLPENHKFSVKKADEISHSFSSSNISPLILKKSNKPNTQKLKKKVDMKSMLPKILAKADKSHGKPDTIQETTEYYQNGAIYEGQKMNNKKHGKGTFHYSDGGRYNGEWKDDMMHGHGVLYYPDGNVAYKGYWALDKFHGYGILNNKKPKKTGNPLDWRDFEKLAEYWTSYEGDFRVDNKEGYGLMYFSNGEKYIGEFKGDKVHGEGNFYAINGNIINGKWENNLIVES